MLVFVCPYRYLSLIFDCKVSKKVGIFIIILQKSLLIALFKKLITNPTPQTVFPVAVFVLELNQRLRIACRAHVEAAFAPHSGDAVVFCTNFLEQRESAVAKDFVVAMATVGEKHRNHRVDDDETARGWRQPLFVLRTGRTEQIMRLPIGCGASVEGFFDFFNALTMHDLTERRRLLVEKLGELRDADMRKILRSQAQESPKFRVDGLQREFAL